MHPQMTKAQQLEMLKKQLGQAKLQLQWAEWAEEKAELVYERECEAVGYYEVLGEEAQEFTLQAQRNLRIAALEHNIAIGNALVMKAQAEGIIEQITEILGTLDSPILRPDLM